MPQIIAPLYRFIDIHTHKTECPASVRVINIDQRQFQSTAPFPLHCSIGLHPWFLSAERLETELSFLNHWTASRNVLAIGECGLDKNCKTDWQLQAKAFIAQIQLANALKKPLIIHCVKAFEEVVHLLKLYKNKVPVIFHGFNKKAAIADKLVKAGHYLSFGASLLQDKNIDAFLHCPFEKLFFETDDSPNEIHQVYEKAASLLNMPLTVLAAQIEINLKKIKIAI